MVSKIVIALVVVIVAFVALAALQPSDFRVSRTAVMAAAPPEVFAQVNDFQKWDAWSPYVKRDPAMRKTYGGPAGGTGAVYIWSGNSEVGEGRATIVESRPNDRIRIELEFLRPFAATSMAEFTFEPEGDRTAVTWSLAGRNGFVAKAMGLFLNMDGMIGGDFEKGLADMKAVVERS